ncbi:bestrophin family protein [Mangrovimonas aestuarii]|uniref:bestrophin family protein n=1 Tax=Mangrovimonas aestuarii TaxID=3018443 RepID=UPI00237887B8|nr:bestrophin family ion channel [Mangrovimonas aestuarii]
MLISKRVRLHTIVSGTWKLLILDLISCSGTYWIYSFFISPHYEMPGLIPSVLGTALAFFIGFNNNQAYDRWWEARKIWGALVNDSRTWARQIIYFHHKEALNKSEISMESRKMIHRHISFLYALKQALRKTSDNEYKKYLSENDIAYVEQESNKPNAILTIQTKELNQLYGENRFDGFKFIELNKMLVNFCDHMGKSERILNTIFPTTYNYYTRIFIWVFIVFVTMEVSESVGAFAIPIGTLIGYVFLTTHSIGQTLLNPFEDLPTGIPLNQITRTIEINLLETLGDSEIPEPVQPIDDEYVM